MTIKLSSELQEFIKCPLCKEQIKLVTCGFTDCSYKWSGIKIIDGKPTKSISLWKIAPEGEYTKCNPLKPDGSSNII